MSSGGAALQPTFTGHVATTQDALILFEACLQGHLSHVPRRPHDRERGSLIRSGCVFIYEENASGIKRWTDGVTWSPSRILGNFLVYRELDKPFPPGEKKRAMKKQNRRPSRPGEPYPRTDGSAYSPNSSQQSPYPADRPNTEMERQLIGSLVDSYGFKADGLVKKTMSVTVAGVTHHLVSYYNVNDVVNSNLRTPAQTDNLQYIRPRPELTSKQSFRSPLEEVEDLDALRDGQGSYGYRMGPHGGYIQDYKTQYYMQQQPYPPMNQQPPGPTYPMGAQPINTGYMQGSVPPAQIPPQRPEYGQYDQAGYTRSYDSMAPSMPAGPKSVPPTPTSSVPPMIPDRSQAQPLMYPPSNIQRPVTELSPDSMDTRNNVPYRPSPYPITSASPVDAHRPGQASPVQIKYEDRRDSNQQPPQMYANSRTPYYGDGSGQHMQQPQYNQPGPQMGQWPSANHTPQ